MEKLNLFSNSIETWRFNVFAVMWNLFFLLFQYICFENFNQVNQMERTIK